MAVDGDRSWGNETKKVEFKLDQKEQLSKSTGIYPFKEALKTFEAHKNLAYLIRAINLNQQFMIRRTDKMDVKSPPCGKKLVLLTPERTR